METSVHAEAAPEKSITARALSLAATARDLGEKALHAKVVVDRVVEEGARSARQALRTGRFAAEDLIDQTTLRVRQKPLRSLGWAFLCGALMAGATLYAFGKIWRRS